MISVILDTPLPDWMWSLMYAGWAVLAEIGWLVSPWHPVVVVLQVGIRFALEGGAI